MEADSRRFNGLQRGLRSKPSPSMWDGLEHSLAVCVVGRDQNASHLMVLARGPASLLAGRALILQTTRFVHNFGELPIRRPNRAPPAATKDGPRTNDDIRNAQVQLIDQ